MARGPACSKELVAAFRSKGNAILGLRRQELGKGEWRGKVRGSSSLSHGQLDLEHRIRDWRIRKEKEERVGFIFGNTEFEVSRGMEMSSGHWVQRLYTRIWASGERPDMRI